MMRNPAMHVRFALVGAATLLSAAAVAAAEPASAPARAPAQPQPRSAPVVLASADQVQAPTPAAQAAAQPKRARVARVTTCRCGDPQAQPEK
jgi:hypothetical protein